MPTLASEYLMNEEVAYGLRVTFSEPVTLTYFDATLRQVDPDGESIEFVFSGAELPAWIGFGLSWAPTSARIVSHEWLATPSATGLIEVDWGAWLPETWSDIDWAAIPFFYRYPEDVGVDFWTADGRDITQSAHREKDGLALSGVKLIISDSWMAIRFEGHETVRGVFEYQLRLNEGNWGPTTYYITLRPNARQATVAMSTPWKHIADIPASRLQFSEASASAILLASELDLTDLSALRNWQVTTHAHYGEEWFQFPGRGPYEGFEALLAGQRFDFEDELLASEAVAEASEPDEHPEWLYNYLDEEADCHPGPPYQIPVFVSVPLLTPLSDRFAVSIDNDTWYALERLDASTLGCELELEQLPASFAIAVERNGELVAHKSDVVVSSAWEAVSLAIPDLEGVPRLATLPETFVPCAGPCDIWGSYLYGIQGEGWSTNLHLRTYVCSTFDRLARMGVEEVFVTSFIGWKAVYPEPSLGYVFAPSGTETIGMLDLMNMVNAAHDAGMRLTLMYNAVGVPWDLDLSYLREPGKPSEWVETVMEQYRQFAVAEAAKAEEYAVDGYTLGFSDKGFDASGQEEIWNRCMERIITEVRDVFTGTLYLSVGPDTAIAVLNGDIPLSLFDGVDALVTYFDHGWYPAYSSDDSISTLYFHMRNSMLNLAAMKQLLGKPLVVTTGLMSYDGYVTDGWYETVGWLYPRRTPDFLEQSHAYEAMLLFTSAYGLFDGVIAYKYHWDDPFGPELCSDTLAQIDLSESTRNKPAEAVLMRWFTPEPGSGLECRAVRRSYD